METKYIDIERPIRTESVQHFEATRYTLHHRAHHWIHLASMIAFFITGFEIYFKEFPLGGKQLTRDLHVYLGFFIIFWSIFIYLVVMILEKKLMEIIPTPRDVLDLIIIVLCAIKILPDSKYPHYDYYDPKKGKYIMKYHPTQKFLAFNNFLMLIFIAITGFALYEEILPGKVGILGTYSMTAIQPLLDLGIQLRLLHFAIFVYFISTTIIHMYFTLLPSNRGRLKGMATGRETILNEQHHQMPRIKDEEEIYS